MAKTCYTLGSQGGSWHLFNSGSTNVYVYGFALVPSGSWTTYTPYDIVDGYACIGYKSSGTNACVIFSRNAKNKWVHCCHGINPSAVMTDLGLAFLSETYASVPGLTNLYINPNPLSVYVDYNKTKKTDANFILARDNNLRSPNYYANAIFVGSTDGNRFYEPSKRNDLIVDPIGYESKLRIEGGEGSASFKAYYDYFNDKTRFEKVDSSIYNDAVPYHLGGEVCTYYATIENPQYRVKHWTVNGEVVANSEGKTEIDITLPSADTEIVCHVELYASLITIKSSDEDGGTVSNAITSQVISFNEEVKSSATLVDERNYEFKGWFKGEGDNLNPINCNIPATDNIESTNLSLVVKEKNETYVAKFEYTRTTLRVSVQDDDGNSDTYGGTFDVTSTKYPEGKYGLTEFEDEEAKTGWVVNLRAHPADGYFFSHWHIPVSVTQSTDATSPSVSLTLIKDLRVHECTAVFLKKLEAKHVHCDITNAGKVYNSLTKETVYEGGYLTNLLTETEVSLTANDIEEADGNEWYIERNGRLYKFDCWQYDINGNDEWVNIKDVAFNERPSWIVNLVENTLTIRVPQEDAAKQIRIRANFVKKSLYTIATPTIEGVHPIYPRTILASASEGNVISSLPEAHEYQTVVNDLTGETTQIPYWVEGTRIKLSASANAKWEVEGFSVSITDEKTITTTTPLVEFTLTNNVNQIFATYKAKQYVVNVKTDENSAKSGKSAVSYLIDEFENGEPKLVTAEEVVMGGGVSVKVYTDTPVTFSFTSRYSGDYVRLAGVFVNGAISDLVDGAQTSVSYDMDVVAKFNVVVKFYQEGAVTEDGHVYPLGKITGEYNGETFEVTSQNELEVACGTPITFSAISETVETASGKTYKGYFGGWSSLNLTTDDDVFVPVVGWSNPVTLASVTTPYAIRASFSKENRWPILRLRFKEKPALGEFIVEGVRSEREQTFENTSGETETVTLENDNDYFCDAYSTVNIALKITANNARFRKWAVFPFDADIDSQLTTPSGYLDETTTEISLVISSNTFLVPIFWQGDPIFTEASFVDGSNIAMGSVLIDGDTISREGESIARFAQGDVATFRAVPMNGYIFDGWFYDQKGVTLKSKDAEFSEVVESAMRYYAKFKQDQNAIYTFGTSSEYKQAHWSSKRIMTNTPVAFSTAQVDAEGYESVTIDVSQSSSPKIPFKHETYTFKNANSKRLRMSRAEKLFEFSIKTTTPINFMAFSTSVGGLIGGA